MLEKFPIPGVHEHGGDGVFAVVIDYCFIWFLVNPQPNMRTSFVGNFKFCDAAITQGLDSLSL